VARVARVTRAAIVARVTRAATSYSIQFIKNSR
jgi:hypothetical protein